MQKIVLHSWDLVAATGQEAAEGGEREELWRLVNDNYNGYQVYQQRAA